MVTVLLLPTLTVYLGFRAGGYFAGTTAWVTVGLAVALAVRLVVSPRTPGRPLGLAAAGLALFALWTLLSGDWSGNYGRALIEFDRVLLYLLVMLLFGSLAQPRQALRFLPLGLGLAAVILCGAGFLARTLPDAWSAAAEDLSRLAYPLSYSNATGFLAALGILCCLHVASWEREREVIRVLAAAALPMLAATLLLTFSRGAVLAGVVGALVYAVLGRPRGLLTVLLGALPFVIVATYAAYNADQLATNDPASPAAVLQGHDLARTVGFTTLGVVAAMVLLMLLERRLATHAFPRPSPRVAAFAAGTVACAVVIAAAIVVPDAIRSLSQDIRGENGGDQALTRDRLAPGALVNPGPQTRVEYWEISLAAFEKHPLRGEGAGSFAERWAKDRPIAESVTEGHSVFLETLGELGLVGLVLIALVFGTVVAAFGVGLRRGRRPLYAAALAAAAAWLVHAGIDWDWEMPTLSIWFFAFGGCALATWGRRRPTRQPPLGVRAALGAACLLVAVTPLAVAVSQSRLDASVEAMVQGDCSEAERLAASASAVLPLRAEPYEIVSYCQARAGQHGRSIATMRKAIARDPGNWELRYGLALVQAMAGRDPSHALAQLRRRNPLEPLTADALARFTDDDPEAWRAQALDAPIPIP